MEYGLTFVVDMYDFERGEEMHILTLPGDYIRMSRWADENLSDAASETVANLRRNYAIAWFAMKRRGMLGDIGLSDELTLEAVDAMADRFSVFVNDMEDSKLPLAQGRG